MDLLTGLVRRVPAGPVLAVISVLGLWAMANAPAAAARVPDLEGLHFEAAAITAGRHGYATRVTRRPGPGIPGTVVAQHPEPGVVLERGSLIDVEVTKGGTRVGVPDVSGLPVAHARRVLVDASLRPGDVTFRLTPGVEPNRVISTDPKPGSTVDAGTEVHIVAAA
jgi:serine/threonine-protein kinase